MLHALPGRCCRWSPRCPPPGTWSIPADWSRNCALYGTYRSSSPSQLCCPPKQLLFIGMVQRESTGVESGISPKVFLSHWTADILFFNLKKTCSLNHKKQFQRLKPKYVAYPIHRGTRCKELIAGSPFKSISDSCPAFPAGNRFCDL
jgi:hypothetical protein